MRKPLQRRFSGFACCQVGRRVEYWGLCLHHCPRSLDRRCAQRNRDSSGLSQINGWAMIRFRN
jgi:hypothetical protein